MKDQSETLVAIDVVRDILECHQSLVSSITTAGGGGASVAVEQLKTMSAMDLIILIAPNGVRFSNKKQRF